jgi:hypothetical protein
VGDDDDRGVLQNTDDAEKVKGNSVHRRRTQRRVSPRGGDDSGALVKTGEAMAVSGGGADQRQRGGVKEADACFTWRGKCW